LLSPDHYQQVQVNFQYYEQTGLELDPDSPLRFGHEICLSHRIIENYEVDNHRVTWKIPQNEAEE
jgi:hypothetical protein